MSKRNKTVLGRMFDIVCCLNTIIKTCELGEELGEGITAFLGSDTRANPCRVGELAMILETTYYHDGEGEFPDIGDTIFSDAAGTMPFDTSTLPLFDNIPANEGTGLKAANDAGLPTGSSGVVQTFTCR